MGSSLYAISLPRTRKPIAVSSPVEKCPLCGQSVLPAQYITAHVASVNQNKQVNREELKTVTTTTTSVQYTDITQHTGGICLKCGLEAEKKLQKVFDIFMIITAAVFVIAEILMSAASVEGGLKLLLGIVLGILFFFILIVRTHQKDFKECIKYEFTNIKSFEEEKSRLWLHYAKKAKLYESGWIYLNLYMLNYLK